MNSVQVGKAAFVKESYTTLGIVNTRLTKISVAIFAPDERLPSSATLVIKAIIMRQMMIMIN